jgi:cysteine desulfuration protein SufE
MSEYKKIMTPIELRENEISEALSDCLDWKEKYAYILDLGQELQNMPEIYKVDANKVSGCASQVWLWAQLTEGKLQFFADSDSLFVKGLVALVLKIYSDLDPCLIAQSKNNFLMESGIIQNLSPNRSNGVASMMDKIRRYALQYCTPAQV